MEIKDVENLAELSRIELTEEEKKETLNDLDSILGYVKMISETDIGDVSPEYDLENVWREDLTRSSQAELDANSEFSNELIIKQFPAGQDNFLKVKKIL